ncbi:MAG: hypothetical protein ABI758_01160 [Candidatus Woesebacteria bacterium]
MSSERFTQIRTNNENEIDKRCLLVFTYITDSGNEYFLTRFSITNWRGRTHTHYLLCSSLETKLDNYTFVSFKPKNLQIVEGNNRPYIVIDGNEQVPKALDQVFTETMSKVNLTGRMKILAIQELLKGDDDNLRD